MEVPGPIIFFNFAPECFGRYLYSGHGTPAPVGAPTIFSVPSRVWRTFIGTAANGTTASPVLAY